MAQIVNPQHFDQARFNEFQAKFCQPLRDGENEGQLNEHKVVSGLPGENQTSVTVTDKPGGVKGFFNSIGRFFRRVFCGGSAQADRNLKSISSDFHSSVAAIFGGEDNIPPAVLKAMGTHDKAGGKMRPLSSFRIKVVKEAIDRHAPEIANPDQDADVGPQQDVQNDGGVQDDANIPNGENEVEENGNEVEENGNEVEENKNEIEENKDEVEEGQEQEKGDQVDDKQQEIENRKRQEELEKIQRQKEEEERLAKLKKEIEEHNGLALKSVPDLKEKLLAGLNDAKGRQENDIREAIRGLGLNEGAAKALQERMSGKIDEQFGGLSKQIDLKVEDLRKEISDAAAKGVKFDGSKNTLAGDLDPMLERCVEEIKKEKDGLFALVKGFRERTSETFKSFAREYFDSKELGNLVTDAFKENGYGTDKLFAANKNLLDALKDDALKGIVEGDDGKEFLKDAENWLDEVIGGKTKGFSFAAPKGDGMAASGKKIAGRILQGFQKKVDEFEVSLTRAKEGILILNGKVKDNFYAEKVRVDFGDSWVGPDDQSRIRNAFQSGYKDAAKELADYAVTESLVSLDDIKNGKLSLGEAMDEITGRANLISEGLRNLRTSKETVELGLQSFVQQTDPYVRMIPEEKRNVFKDVMFAKVDTFLRNDAFSSNGRKEHSAFDKSDEVFERLAESANPDLKKNGLPELSTVRIMNMSEILKRKTDAEGISKLFGSTKEKLDMWKLDGKDADAFSMLADSLNATLDKAVNGAMNVPRNDESDGEALAKIFGRAIETMQALKKVSVMIDLYCGTVKDGEFRHEKLNLGAENRKRLVDALSKAMEDLVVTKAGGDPLSEEGILRVFGERIRDEVAPHVTLGWKAQAFDLDGILAAIGRNQLEDQLA